MAGNTKIKGIDFNATLIVEILIGVAALSVIGYFVYEHFQEKKEQENVSKLFGMEALSGNGMAAIISRIPQNDLSKAKTILDSLDLSDIGDLIYSSSGWFNDDEERVYFTLSALKTKLGLAYFSEYFKNTYNEPLLTFLQSYMNQYELSRVYDIISKLPEY